MEYTGMERVIRISIIFSVENWNMSRSDSANEDHVMTYTYRHASQPQIGGDLIGNDMELWLGDNEWLTVTKRVTACWYAQERVTVLYGSDQPIVWDSSFKFLWPWFNLSLSFSVSFVCVTWLIRVCDMTHSCAWHESFVCVTWLIGVCDMTHSCVWHDACVRHIICVCIIVYYICVCVYIYIYIYIYMDMGWQRSVVSFRIFGSLLHKISLFWKRKKHLR